MQAFRRFTEGTLGKVILVCMVLPFVLAGFYGYFSSGSSANQVAKVGDSGVSKTALQNAIQSRRQQLRQSNPQLNARQVSKMVSPVKVMQGLINDTLLQQAAANANMVVTKKQVSHDLIKVPAFQDDNGNFSTNLFKQQVASRGYTPAGFISLLQTDGVRRQLRAAYGLTDFALPSEFKALQQLSGQTRDIAYTKVSLSSIVDSIKVSDADAKAYFSNHQANYKRPPQIRIQWLEINPDEYHIKVTDAEVQKEYQARKKMRINATKNMQQRQISDIFVAINDKRDAQAAEQEAKKLKQQLVNGANFSKLAKAHSDDPITSQKGGDLGWLLKAALPDGMAEAAFALDKGAISAPIKTKRGYHLVKVTGIKTPDMPDVDSLRSKIVKDIRKQQLLLKISEDSNKLSDLAFEHSGLKVPADKLSLSIHTSDWFSPAKPTGFAAQAAVKAELDKGPVKKGEENSKLIDLKKNRYAVIHVSDHRKASQLPFAEVKQQVVKAVKFKRASEKLDDLAKQAKSATDLKAVAADWHGNIKQLDQLTRRDKRLQPDVRQKIFALAPTTNKTPTITRDIQGDLWAIQLNNVTPGHLALDDKTMHMALSRLAQMRGQQDLSSYLNWLRSTITIEVHQDVLKDI